MKKSILMTTALLTILFSHYLASNTEIILAEDTLENTYISPEE